MSIYRTQTMQPRNGHTLVVLNPNRISGCVSQKDVSLEDQHEHAREVVQEIYDGDKVDYRVIATKGKGELNTRPELKKIENALRSSEIDVMIVEDLGRLIRGTEANRLCGIAVDHDTRVIAVHDCIDTWEDGWEEDVIAACRDHVGHNAHTSKRLKKKLMLRFKRKGAATP
jgi:site-specific DNA recombinase